MNVATGEDASSVALGPNSQDTSDASQSSYAFLVHSQDTLNRHLPPVVDNQPLARQRRRRTSPEDHAILEAEYARNPKPDKALRTAIVDRVALGEKEVQIWFQNRRQTTRRKSRPLLPHEVAGFRSSQESVEDATYSSFSIDESSQQQPWSSQSSNNSSQSPPEQKHILPPVENVDKEQARDFPEIRPSDDSLLGIVFAPTQTTNIMGLSVSSAEIPGESSDNTMPFSQDLSVFSGIPGIPTIQQASARRESQYKANRRSAQFSIYQESHAEVLSPAMPLATPSSAPPKGSNPESIVPQPLKRTSSVVRLSMSLDGKAKVTTGDESSPSPPRSKASPGVGPAPRPKTSLQRSQSAMETTNKTPIESILSSSVNSRRPMTGRSRDARSWEFYCDSDARDALTIQAEREQSGSAAGAIGLIRSQSNKAMATNPNKRNAHQPKHESMKRLKPDGQQLQNPKFSRAISSVARLQSVTGNAQKEAVKPKGEEKDLKSSSQSALYQSYEGDSDKENWEPGTRTSNIRRRRPVDTEQNTRTRRPVLEESLHVPSQSSSLDTLMNRKITENRRISIEASSDKENSSPDEDEEAKKFTSGASAPREVEDLDCVQNLLSLSQAAWQ